MIPRKIELKNFLSYGEDIQSIDFSEHSLICLSGKNGNGKSALLDAMTWALWGQARKISGAMKPDDGLIRLGQNKMLVSLEFEIGSSIYRIRREFSKAQSKALLLLDFEIYNPSLEKFVCLTEKTSKMTQAKIENLVGLDYETFINSAFLRQGQSNEFSKKSPKERKQILANILGFSKYDKLQQIAFEKIRKFNDEKKLLLLGQEQSDLEILKEPEITASLNNTHQQNQALSKKIEELNSTVLATHEQKNKLLEQKNIYSGLENELGKIQKKSYQKLDEFKEIAKQWKAVHYKALKLPDPTQIDKQRRLLIDKEKEYFELKREDLKFQESVLQKKDFYQKRMALLESEFDKKLNELKLSVERSQFTLTQTQQSLKQKNQQITDLKNKRDAFVKELDQVSKKLKGKEIFDSTFNRLKAQFDKRKAFYQTMIEKGNMSKSERNELDHKKIAVQDMDNPSCPFCEQILTAKRKQFLSTKITKSESVIEFRLLRIHNILKKLKTVLLEQHKQIEDLTKESDLYKHMTVKFDDLKKRIEEYDKDIDTISKEINDLEKKISDVTKNLKTETENLLQQESIRLTHFAKDTELEKTALEIKDIESKIKLLKPKLETYVQLQDDIKVIDSLLKDLELIHKEIQEQPQRKKLLNICKNDLKEMQAQILETEKKLLQNKVDPDIEQRIEKTLTDLNVALNESLKQKELFMQQIGQLQSELQRIQKLKEASKIRSDQIKIIEREIDDYQILATTFSKNGIQALLIEEAIPEIETEANRILARLTDNQAQIFIESLRDLKQGGVKETMDIQISDSAGIRPYELYSGGEAFRFDFALRIAISKLLARRAGTALQTLIIDEGFGSQDDDGLSKVMSAIHAIQDDFLKIIIVSHLNEFKDNFPVHFIIEKNSTGSIVKIEERG